MKSFKEYEPCLAAPQFWFKLQETLCPVLDVARTVRPSWAIVRFRGMKPV